MQLAMTSHELLGTLNIWWFPKEFSQSRYGRFMASGTNSCTLICLILGDRITKEQHGFLQSSTELPQHIISMFGTAMNEGNGVYNRALSQPSTTEGLISPLSGRNKNFNIPDALSVLRKQPSMNFQLHEWFYTHIHTDPTKETYRASVANRLVQVFKMGVELFRESTVKEPNPPRYLFAVLIAALRTVIFVFEIPINVVALFDSHQHGSNLGAIIAQCPITNVAEICNWFVHMLHDVYASQPSTYEVSFLTAYPENILQGPKLEQYTAKTSSST